MFLVNDGSKKENKKVVKTNIKSHRNICKINCYNCHDESFTNIENNDIFEFLEMPNSVGSFNEIEANTNSEVKSFYSGDDKFDKIRII